MRLGSRVGLISDVHGEHRLLREVLDACETSSVETIVVLGDLFDRVDHAEACLRQLSFWQVTGVLGNHERDALIQANIKSDDLERALGALVANMEERLVIGEATFVHDEFGWKPEGRQNGHGRAEHTWVTFAGHTHFRSARDDFGPIDISMGRIQLSSKRRYLVNPGAVVEGQFAIWDREQAIVHFHRV